MFKGAALYKADPLSQLNIKIIIYDVPKPQSERDILLLF